MPRNDNPHALRLADALCLHQGSESAEAFAQAHPLGKSADPEKKFRWACEVCQDLTKTFGTDVAAAIRRDCRCNDGRTMAQQILRCLRQKSTLTDACALFTQENPYAFLEYVNEHELCFGYHACVCSCVKRIAGTLPLTWCECSAGYALNMFHIVFPDRTVHVELLGSVKAGDERCRMRVLLS